MDSDQRRREYERQKRQEKARAEKDSTLNLAALPRACTDETAAVAFMERHLIKQIGRRETAGRPMLYATTDEFLNHFGLNDLSQLPELEDVVLPEQPAQVEEPQAEEVASSE